MEPYFLTSPRSKTAFGNIINKNNGFTFPFLSHNTRFRKATYIETLSYTRKTLAENVFTKLIGCRRQIPNKL